MSTNGADGSHSDSGGWIWRVTSALDDRQRRAVRQLVERVNREYAIPALSDDGRAALMARPATEPGTGPALGPADVRHGLVHGPDGALEGYLQVRPAPLAGEAVLTRSAARATATRLLLAELTRGDREPLPIWVHGQRDPVSTLVRATGAHQVRELLQLRARLTGPPDRPPATPAGLRLRTFRPGLDDESWLTANRDAFAALPDQGAWTSRDLRLRLAEPWFQPADFFLLVDDDDRIAGFHWTKIHQPASSGSAPVGEVYALGVIPACRRRGLADYLLRIGLDHLHGLGIRDAMLYVDAANPAARRLYERFGFRHRSTDRQFLIDPQRIVRSGDF